MQAMTASDCIAEVHAWIRQIGKPAGPEYPKENRVFPAWSRLESPDTLLLGCTGMVIILRDDGTWWAEPDCEGE